jgi:hypothetical protein
MFTIYAFKSMKPNGSKRIKIGQTIILLKHIINN